MSAPVLLGRDTTKSLLGCQRGLAARAGDFTLAACPGNAFNRVGLVAIGVSQIGTLRNPVTRERA